MNSRFGFILVLPLAILLALCVLRCSAAADTYIDNDLVTSDDLAFSDSVIHLSANITVQGRGSLTLDRCLISFEQVRPGASYSLSILDDSSVSISNSTIDSENSACPCAFFFETNGSVLIRHSILKHLGDDLGSSITVEWAQIHFMDSVIESPRGPISFAHCTHVELSNLTIGGEQGDGIRIVSCSQVSIVGCDINGFTTGRGLSISSSAGCRVNATAFSNNLIGVSISRDSRDHVISFCRFSGHLRAAVLIENNRVEPGPIIAHCQFLEDYCAISSDSTSTGVVIMDSLLRFVTVGVDMGAGGWWVLNNTFEYCLEGIYETYARTFNVIGNRFISCVAQAVFSEEIGIEDYKTTRANISGNLFSGGPGVGIELSLKGDAEIANNTFFDLRGGGVEVWTASGVTMVDDTFTDCGFAVECRDSSLALRRLSISGCAVGIKSKSCTISMSESTVGSVAQLVLSDSSDIEIPTGSIDGDTRLSCDRSTVRLGSDLVIAAMHLSLSNATVAKIVDNPTTGRVVVELDTGSILDLIDCPSPSAACILDDLSTLKTWWRILVHVSRLSDGGAMPGMPVAIHDEGFQEVLRTSTDAFGETPVFDLLATILMRNGMHDLNPHIVSIEYRRVNVSIEVEVTGQQDIFITVDDVPPAIIVSWPPNGTTLDGAEVEMTGTASDGSRIVALGVAADGGQRLAIAPVSPWSAYLTLEEGAHLIVVTAVDELGNEGRAEVVVRVDLFPPFIAVTQPAGGDQLNVDRVEVIGTTEPRLRVSCSNASTVADARGEFHVNVTLQGEGHHELAVTVSDAFDRTSTFRLSIYVDWTNPFVSLDGGQSPRNITHPSIAGHVSESIASCVVQGKPVSMATDLSFSTTVDLLEGANLIMWTCTDLAGNTGTGEIAILVDTIVNLTIEYPQPGCGVAQGWLEVRGRTDPGAEVVEVASGTAIRAAGDGMFTIRIWSGAPGPNSITLRAVDATNNSRDATLGYEVLVPPSTPRIGHTLGVLAMAVISAIVLTALLLRFLRSRRGSR